MNYSSKKFWNKGPGSILIAIVVALFLRWLFFEPYVIPSGSMLPSLLKHDHIFVDKSAFGVRVPFTSKWLLKFSGPKRGEVVVFRYPEDNSTIYIKRVVGLPGDKIFYDSGNLYVNDEIIQKTLPRTRKSDFDWLESQPELLGDASGEILNNYIHWEESFEGTSSFSILLRDPLITNTYGPVEVGPEQLFVLGDNRDDSRDSRFWGMLPEENILGRASFVWLSCEKNLPLLPICNPLALRFKRFFHSVH